MEPRWWVVHGQGVMMAGHGGLIDMDMGMDIHANGGHTMVWG